MPPTVMTPWFAAGCVLGVVLVGPAAAMCLPAVGAFAPELGFAAGAFFPDAVWPPDAVPPLVTGATDALPLLDGAGAAGVALLLGVAVPELPVGADEATCPEETCPATAAGCAVVELLRCEKS